MLFERTVLKNIQKTKELKIQGPFLRLSLLPTSFTKYIWNRENNPICPLCFRKTESIAHVMNSCKEFQNFYSRHHDRIVTETCRIIKENRLRDRVYENKLFENIVPELRDVVKGIIHRKPDIVGWMERYKS